MHFNVAMKNVIAKLWVLSIVPCNHILKTDVLERIFFQLWDFFEDEQGFKHVENHYQGWRDELENLDEVPDIPKIGASLTVHFVDLLKNRHEYQNNKQELTDQVNLAQTWFSTRQQYRINLWKRVSITGSAILRVASLRVASLRVASCEFASCELRVASLRVCELRGLRENSWNILVYWKWRNKILW